MNVFLILIFLRWLVIVLVLMLLNVFSLIEIFGEFILLINKVEILFYVRVLILKIIIFLYMI